MNYIPKQALFCALLLTLALLVEMPPSCAAETSKEITSGNSISITDFGAVGDDATLNTKTIQSVIDQLTAKGGGTVVIPQGVFLTGALFLKPGVNLHLEKNAVLKGSTDMTNYPLRRIRIEGHFEEHYASGLINAESCDGLRITGEGTLDGNGRPIWDKFWQLRRAIKDPKQYRNFRNLSILRAQLCIINHSTNVVIDGVTFKDSQYWNLHLYDCRDVMVQNARFQVPDNYKQAPSTDGVDVDSSQDVVIKGCYFSVTDDCIAMKGTWGPFALEDKASMPVEHVRVEKCVFKRGGAVTTLGSDASVVRDVVVENCRVIGPVNVVLFKLRADTPQCYENIHYRNITLDNRQGGGSIVGISPWSQYTDLKGQPPPKSVVRDITISDIKGRTGSFGSILPNLGQTEISGITLENIDVQLKDERLKTDGKVENLKIENVRVNGKPFSP